MDEMSRYYHFWMVAKKDGDSKNINTSISVDLGESKNKKAKKKMVDLGYTDVRILNSVEINREAYLESKDNELLEI